MIGNTNEPVWTGRLDIEELLIVSTEPVKAGKVEIFDELLINSIEPVGDELTAIEPDLGNTKVEPVIVDSFVLTITEPDLIISKVEIKELCLNSVFSVNKILPVTVFGFVSILCFSFSYFCFSNIVGFISTPTPASLPLNVERAGVIDFKPSKIEWLNTPSCTLINSFTFISIGFALKNSSLKLSNVKYDWE